MITLINTTATQESQESVLFQPVLKAYLTCHSWIITAHVSLGNLDKQWRTFIRQMDRTQQLLHSIHQRPSAPTHLISTLQAEFTNLGGIYTPYRPLILAATQLLEEEPSFDGISTSNKHVKRSLLPFQVEALIWLMGTAMTKDVTSIKKRVNQFIMAQNMQQETLVHIISVLNITRYATQVNRQHINIVMDAVDRTHQDITTLFNISNSLYNSLGYQQIVLYICSILANHRESLHYIRETSMHTMDYIDATTTRILSPHLLPMEDLRKMLLHIEEMLPLTMHLPVSCEDTLHFYRYLCTHILITDQLFLFLINVPIQDHEQQLEIYEVFSLDIPQGNFAAHYNINNKYLGITYDETEAVEILEQQFSICQKTNGQFCSINAPLQPLANPPSCIAAIYAKNKANIETRCSIQIWNANSVSIPMPIAPNVWILTSAPSIVPMGITLICPKEASRFITMQKPIHILQLPLACSTTSQHFHLPPRYETHELSTYLSMQQTSTW